MSRSPVVTGLGLITASGCGTDAVWQSIIAGADGLRPLTLFQSPRYGQVLAGELDLPTLGAPSFGSRSDRLAWLSARQAIASANLSPGERGERCGILLGSSVGGSFDSERFLTALMKRSRMRARPTRFHECVSAVEWIADSFECYGPSMAIATACSSGALAISTAAELILAGEADVMLAGGADSLSRMTWGGFHSLLLVDAAGCRPFDANRAGMSLGEGGAMLVLEAEAHARRRGAPILARLTGWGASCDAHHATAPHPQGAGAARAMESALRRADLQPAAIDYVNAHGTGTRDNDLAEGLALKTVFGSSVPPFSSTKRFFGHALAASGAIEAIVCIEALRRQQMPPNPGFTNPDPAIGLQPITAPTPGALRHLMSNSFGFGGNNAVLIFSQPELPASTRAAGSRPVAVTGIGVVGPGEIGTRAIEAPLPSATIKVRTCGQVPDTGQLTPGQRRRLGRLLQMSLVAARRGRAPGATNRIAVAMGTGLGCLEDAGAFIENLIALDEREPMPARFPNSVHNAAAAQIAMDQSAHGLNSAPTAGEISFECALWQGMRQLNTNEADVALVGAVDELNKYPLSIGRRWGFWSEKILPGEGAAVASLAPVGEPGKPLARVTAVQLGRYRRPFDARREVDWIATAVDLSAVDLVLSGAGGAPVLDSLYEAVIAELSSRAGRQVEHRGYKDRCGEFHAASAFGFSVALELVREGRRGVLLYTLAIRGGKALCFLQPWQGAP